MATDKVALLEGGANAPDPEMSPDALVDVQPQMTDRRQSTQSVNFDAGGAGGEPVVSIATSERVIELGYEDIFLMILLADIGLRAFTIVRGEL